MSSKILISFFAAIVIPSAIILYFVGLDAVFTILKVLAVIILISGILFYLLFGLGKGAFGKLSLSFDDGLKMTSSLLKYMTVLDLTIVIISAAITILTFLGYIRVEENRSYFLEVKIVLYDILFFLSGMVAYIASFKILKFSRSWFFLTILISIPHAAVLLGIFPILFLVANSSFYFAASSVKTVDSYKTLQDLRP